MRFLKFLSVAFQQELKPLFISWLNPSNNKILSDLLSEQLYDFYSCFQRKCRLLGPDRHEICKVTKIQHVKLNVTFADQRYLEGLIVETDVGRDGRRAVPASSDAGTGGGERFLIVVRALGY